MIRNQIGAIIVLGFAAAASAVPVRYNGKLYDLAPSKHSSLDAEAAAAALAPGAHLVTIDSQAEQNWLLSQFGGTEKLWIGLTDAENEGEWKWLGGASSDYRNWDAGQPDNSGGEDAVLMNLDGTWSDVNSINAAAFRGIAEWTPEPPSEWVPDWEFAFDPKDFYPEVSDVDIYRIRPDGVGGCVFHMRVRGLSGYFSIVGRVDQKGALSWQYPVESADDSDREIVFATPELVVLGDGFNEGGARHAKLLTVSGGKLIVREAPERDRDFKSSGYPGVAPLSLRSGLVFGEITKPDYSILILRKYSFSEPSAPTIANTAFSGLEGSNFVISWNTDPSVFYQVQRSGDLEAWEDVGGVITGSGEAMRYSEPAEGTDLFLRVIIP